MYSGKDEEVRAVTEPQRGGYADVAVILQGRWADQELRDARERPIDID